MTKLAPEWVRTSDPVIRSPARYRWTTTPATDVHGEYNLTYELNFNNVGNSTCMKCQINMAFINEVPCVKLHLVTLSVKMYLVKKNTMISIGKAK